MSLSIAAVVGGSMCLIVVAGGVAGLSEHNRQRRRKWASQAWRDVTLRNGVTAQSPFHVRASSFNAPGLVEVFPQTHSRRSDASVLQRSEPVHSASPRPSSDIPNADSTAVHTSDEPADELPCEPMALSDPPHEAEGARCRRLYQQGMSQTKVIKEVWGLSKGGSKKYYEARDRFRKHVADIATGDLKTSIQAEIGGGDA